MQICFSVFLILYAFSEYTPKVFIVVRKYTITIKLNHIPRKRQKACRVHGDYSGFRVVLGRRGVNPGIPSLVESSLMLLGIFISLA
jgi:hypothetical protein